MNELPTIDVDAAAADTTSYLLDVREYQEWIVGHVDRAVHIPMGEVVGRVAELPRDRRIICICRSGNRSGRVTAWLVEQGYDATNMAGGVQRWAAAGHPLVDDNGGPGAVA